MQDACFCGPAYSPISHVSTCLTAWFLRRFGLKTGAVDVLCPFWFRIEYGFRGRYERILRFNSKRVICEFEMGVFWRSNLTRNDDVIFDYVGLNTGTDFRGREGHVFRKARKLFGPKEKFNI